MYLHWLIYNLEKKGFQLNEFMHFRIHVYMLQSTLVLFENAKYNIKIKNWCYLLLFLFIKLEFI